MRVQTVILAVHVACCSLLLALAGCGDDILIDDTPLPHVQTLVFAAHFDDDEIFMQPELVDAVKAGSITSVFIATGDAIHGVDHQLHVMEGSMIAYGEIADSQAWQCGYTTITGLPARQCRLPDRGITLVALNIPDGGIEGAQDLSLLHLLDGSLRSLPVLGPIGGSTVTRDDIVNELSAIITASAPAQIHALDVGGNHGYDHSSHVLGAAMVMWAAARIGYNGPLRAHRGYDVENDTPTLLGVSYALPEYMLGYFDACYLQCAPCGESCAVPNISHQIWLQRQYAWDRVASGSGSLALSADTALCASASGGQLVLADCASASPLVLAATGALTIGGQCVTADDDGSVTLATCTASPDQYWLLDGEGSLWNGLPVTSPLLDTYDHARCLSVNDTPGATLTAPICGLNLKTTWTLAP